MSAVQAYHKISRYVPEFTADIEQACAALALSLTDAQKNALLAYLDGLLLWTKAYNLTAITDPKEALVKHIFDCLAIVPSFGRTHTGEIKSVLDIGTGAGLPAVILAIVRPDWHITALDSNSKKIRFIRQMASELGLKNITPEACRIEAHEGVYDVISSRAFASLEDFVTLATPYLANDGVLCAMKGKTPTPDELSVLGSWQISIDKLNVPSLSDERCLVHLNRA